jgi:pyruvate kinase
VIEHVRAAGDEQRRPLLFMDLGGAKLRVASWAKEKKRVRLQLGDSFLIDTGFVGADGGAAQDANRRKKTMKVNEPAALSGVQPGQMVWFDDGKIGGIVREAGGEGIRVEVTHVKRGGRKLRIERGLNLPGSMLNLPALTEKDLEDLAFAATKADLLALSFIRTVDDVEAFRQALTSVPNGSPAMVIKIETLEAVTHLPALMLAAMRHDRVAFLLARGDLAVECGFLELPRIQREVVRFCAAASMPLFWATGVMERASRTGEPSRAEITDVEEAAHAQCVMLNKGPRIADALGLLRAQLERRRNDE